MKDISVFDFKECRDFLKQAFPIRGKERGSRTRLAELLGCQSGFISQVLGGHASFSPEHAIQIAKFMGLSPEEQEFFMLLIQLDRAGTRDLTDYYKNQIDSILKKRREIVNRVKAGQIQLTDLDRQLYYSSWQHIAVHMCLVISQLQTKKAISRYLGIPEERVAAIVEDLLATGLARLEGGRYFGKYDRLHLPSTSPLILKHHSNWRMKAIQSLDQIRSDDLHYSLVMSISRSAAEKMRAAVVNLIQNFEPIMKEAKDECVYVFNADLFDLAADAG